MKEDKEIDEDSRRECGKRHSGHKKSPDGLSQPNQNPIIINIIL